MAADKEEFKEEQKMIKSEMTKIYTNSRGDYDKVDILTTYRKPTCPASIIHESPKPPAETTHTFIFSFVFLLLVLIIYLYPSTPTLHFSNTSETHQPLQLFEQYLQSNQIAKSSTNISYSEFLSQFGEDQTQELGQIILESMFCRLEHSKIKCSVELVGSS